MSYQSEAKLEEKLLSQLVDMGYQKIDIKDEDALHSNFRKIVNRRNIERLGGLELSDKEFERLLIIISGKSVFESAKILRDKHVLTRDDNSKVYIELFDVAKWCINEFQVFSQITMEKTYENRYDVTILINGLPVVQIELKRSGIDVNEAFNQIDRYRKHSYKGLFRYIQIYVVSNSQETRYFSNSDNEILKSHMFYWSDANNKRINKLEDFAYDFLEKCRVSKIIARYMIINETDKQLMIMRPYQVYAVETIVDRATETGNNGYVWHTTGSGKTLTSFKASQILSNESNIEKVFFLVDRRDLDSQTIDEFNKFEPDSVDMVDSTASLVKKIKDSNKKMIVTTIQKMSNAINKNAHVLEEYRKKRVIFIIDECHRTQFGDMHKAISSHFENAQYFGFTGTPRFPENKSQDGRVTTDIFEKCLHKYLIKDAIRDGNVLGFSVEYISTFKSHINENDETKAEAINTDEVWMADERIESVVKHIISIHDSKTRNKEYTAILTVQSIDMLVKYYDAFKNVNSNLKIAGIYTFGANEESKGIDSEHSRDSLERIMKDYNITFGTNYSTDTFKNYFSDVSKNVKKAQIDILLVVDMFLTGFDSKTLNTLYVDRNLQYHGLIQAYSRTNRVEKDTKPYGNIVCYRNLKEQTDKAIQLFSNEENTDVVLMLSYDKYIEQFQKRFEELQSIAPSPEEVDELESEEDQKVFVLAFREISKLILRLKTFTEFEFNKEKLGIDEQTFEDYKSKYFAIYDNLNKTRKKDEVSILADIDFAIEVLYTDIINVSYIMNLMRHLNLSNVSERNRGIKEIMTQLEKADSKELRLKVDLIKEFLNKVVPTLDENDNVNNAYDEFEERQKNNEIISFAAEEGIEKDSVEEKLAEYEFSGSMKREELVKIFKGEGLKERVRRADLLEKFIKEIVEKYSSK
ncbi:MAG: type I restriction endonuclease subunit R [Fusobacteriaceae bacterium]|nr:type I restriction endonuclease subunit R [Fusobacteriaceae bacterium]